MLKPQSYAWGIDAGYAREPALLALLAARGIPAPANAEAVLGDDGRLAAIAYDYIEGVTVSALGRAARATLAREVGAALTALHAVPVEEARALGVPELDLGEELYRPMVEACLPHLGPRGRAWLERRFASFIEGGGSLRRAARARRMPTLAARTSSPAPTAASPPSSTGATRSSPTPRTTSPRCSPSARAASPSA